MTYWAKDYSGNRMNHTNTADRNRDGRTGTENILTYLDSAATTLQKPATVAHLASFAINHLASPGRGGYHAAMLAADTAFACRQAAAELFHVDSPENVIFTLNATHALNLAIKSTVQPGDTVLISGFEHNAVTRPLHCMDNVQIKIATSPLFEPDTLYRRFEEQLTDEVAAVICTHVSNVFGYILPVERIAALCRARHVPFILDASQSAGCLDISMEALGAAFIAMPGHKGLYGPQGTGILLCNAETSPLLEGGTGSVSVLQTMPDFLPDQLEAGTHNIPGIAGLLEGIRFVSAKRTPTILAHETALTRRAINGLAQIPGARFYAASQSACQAGVISFNLDGMDSEDVGAGLSERGIAVRAGLHCAPLAHQSAGTLETGTVRASFSVFNTPADVDRFLSATKEIAEQLHAH